MSNSELADLRSENARLRLDLELQRGNAAELGKLFLANTTKMAHAATRVGVASDLPIDEFTKAFNAAILRIAKGAQ